MAYYYIITRVFIYNLDFEQSKQTNDFTMMVFFIIISLRATFRPEKSRVDILEFVFYR